MNLNSSPVDLKARADELYAAGDYAAAAEEYRKLVEAQPHSSSAMKSLGLSLVLSKKVDEGVQICKTAAAMQPADAEVRYAYGYALGAANRFGEAIPELDAALNLQPNHVPARQGLIYCLLSYGQSLVQGDPLAAEQNLDRARKLDAKNAHIAATLLDFYVKAGQRGKAVKLIQALDDSLKRQSPLKELIAGLQEDPEYRTHLRQVSVAKQAAGPSVSAAPPPTSSLKQVPCPNCQQPIMDYAAICPHCNFRIRATGTFAGRDTGPKYEWQEIAYTIMSIVWTVIAGFQFWQAFPEAQAGGFTNFSSLPMISAATQALIGLGLLFRQEWIAFIAKIFCWVTLLPYAIWFTVYLSAGRWVPALITGAEVAVTGFMLYLMNYVMGD